MKKENVKHLKLSLEISSRGDYCDVSFPFLSPRSACRLFGYLRFEGINHIRHYHCRKFTKVQDND